MMALIRGFFLVLIGALIGAIVSGWIYSRHMNYAARVAKDAMDEARIAEANTAVCIGELQKAIRLLNDSGRDL